MIVCLDGEFMPHAEAAIPIDDRGFLFGDGVFETALLHDGGFFRLRPHLERLAASAAVMRIPAPTLDELDRIVREVCRRNALDHANIRITLTRGASAPLLLVTARKPDPSAIERARQGWALVTARTRRPATTAVPAQLKALGRTYALLARHEAADAGVDDALLLGADGTICEGPTWNVFWRSGSTLVTPHLDAGVLAGVTRSAILHVADAAGYEVREVLAPRSELDAADEIFASMTSLGIVPIRRLDARVMPHATPAADALQPRLDHLIATEAAGDPL